MPRPRLGPKLRADVVRACAVETRVKISQDSLYTEILRKNAAAQSEHPDQAPAFTPRKNPSLWTYCLGKTNITSITDFTQTSSANPTPKTHPGIFPRLLRFRIQGNPDFGGHLEAPFPKSPVQSKHALSWPLKNL